MQQAKAVGRNAPALKYDILTAMMVMACHDAGTEGRLAGRLAVLITARFNWQRGSFATGQREIARLWGVTERTAKRELAAMRAKGWISVRKPAARGRVAEHAIDLERILIASRPIWPAVGPDFVARLSAGYLEEPAVPSNIVPFQVPTGPVVQDGSLWARASEGLRKADPELHAAWFMRLEQAGHDGGRLTLLAPSPFVASYVSTHLIGRLLAAVSMIDPAVMTVRVDCGA